jgi:hypothetical protein
MGSVIYTPMMEVAQEEEIIKQIIEDEQNSNMSGDDVKAICSKIGNTKTKEDCYGRLQGDDKTSYSEKDLIAYYKAVGKGYTKSIDEFLKKKDTISKALGYGVSALGLLSGLASSKSNQGTDYSTPIEDSKGLSTGAKWGIGIGSVAIIGTVLYFVFKGK